MALSKYATKLLLWFNRYKIGNNVGDKQTVKEFDAHIKSYRRGKIYSDSIQEIIDAEEPIAFPYTFDFDLT